MSSCTAGQAEDWGSIGIFPLLKYKDLVHSCAEERVAAYDTAAHCFAFQRGSLSLFSRLAGVLWYGSLAWCWGSLIAP